MANDEEQLVFLQESVWSQDLLQSCQYERSGGQRRWTGGLSRTADICEKRRRQGVRRGIRCVGGQIEVVPRPGGGTGRRLCRGSGLHLFIWRKMHIHVMDRIIHL